MNTLNQAGDRNATRTVMDTPSAAVRSILSDYLFGPTFSSPVAVPIAVYPDIVVPASLPSSFLGIPRRVQRCSGAPRRPAMCSGAPRRIARCGAETSDFGIYMTASWNRLFTRTTEGPRFDFDRGGLIRETSMIPVRPPFFPSGPAGFAYGMRSHGVLGPPVQVGRHWMIDDPSHFYTPGAFGTVSYRNAPGTILTFNEGIDYSYPFAEGRDSWLYGDVTGYPEYKENFTVNGVTYPAVLRMGVWIDMFTQIPCCNSDLDSDYPTVCIPETEDDYTHVTDCHIRNLLPNCFRAGTPIDEGGCVGPGGEPDQSVAFGFHPYLGQYYIGSPGGGYSLVRYVDILGRVAGFAWAYLMFDAPFNAPFDGELPACVGGYLDVAGPDFTRLGNTHTFPSDGWPVVQTLESRSPGDNFQLFLPNTQTQTGALAWATNNPVDVTQRVQFTSTCGSASYDDSETIEDVFLHIVQINVVLINP